MLSRAPILELLKNPDGISEKYRRGVVDHVGGFALNYHTITDITLCPRFTNAAKRLRSQGENLQFVSCAA